MVTKDLKLCYIRDNWAWFTDQPLDAVWGDDWDDRPYQDNAGDPYSVPNFSYIKIAWEGPFIVTGGNWSVQDFNSGKVAWLVEDYIRSVKTESILAGITFRDFVNKIISFGGCIYYPASFFFQS